ncbi:MAG: hypothetical protein HC788_12425 [Sphingopyxis sp.]|nr:hypothetical protein [Sphingopyxis sp.]
MASAAPDPGDEPATPARRTGRGWLYGAATIALLGGGLWLLRAPVADNIVANQLDKRDVAAQYEVQAIGPRTQILTNVVIGKPERPDLRAKRVEVDIGWSWSGPVVKAIRADGVRLQGKWVDGRLSLGEVDKLLPPPSDEAFTLPDIALRLTDARGRFETPWGVFGGRVDGAGSLRRDFRGQVALVSEALAVGGCTTDRVTLYGALRIDNAGPRFSGPVRGAAVDCPQSTTRLARFDAVMNARLGSDLQQWTGDVDMVASGLTAAAGSFAAVTGKVGFAGDPAETKATFDLTGANGRYANVRVGSAKLAGTAQFGDDVGGTATLGFDRMTLPPAYRAQLQRAVAGLKASPIAPIADALARSAADAMTDVSGEAVLVLAGSSPNRRIDVIAPRLASASGVRLTGDGASRLSILWADRSHCFCWMGAGSCWAAGCRTAWSGCSGNATAA